MLGHRSDLFGLDLLDHHLGVFLALAIFLTLQFLGLGEQVLDMALGDGVEVHDSAHTLLLVVLAQLVDVTTLEPRTVGVVFAVSLGFLAERLQFTDHVVLGLIGEAADLGVLFLLSETGADLFLLDAETLSITVTVGTGEASAGGLDDRLGGLHHLAHHLSVLGLPDHILVFTVRAVGVTLQTTE